MNVVLLEFIDEAQALIKRHGIEFFKNKDTIVVCLHPKVRVFLKNRGIDSCDTIDYLDNDAQHRIVLKTEELTTRISKEMELKDSLGIKKAYEETFIHHIRLYINHFLWLIEILEGITEIHKVSKLFCCLPKPVNTMYQKAAYIQDSERFLGLLARDFCNIEKIDFQGIDLKPSRPSIFSYAAARIIRKIGELLANIEYNSVISDKVDRDKSLVVPALSYNMGTILDKIKQKHPASMVFGIWEGKDTLKAEASKVLSLMKNLLKKRKKNNILDNIIMIDLIRDRFRDEAGDQKKIDKEFDNLKGSIELKESNSFIHQSVPYQSYLIEKIDRSLRHEILLLNCSTRALYNILKSLKPALLMSMYSVGIYYTMGELSRILGFESLNISHGTHVPPNNLFEKIENYRLATSVILNTYNQVAVQTPWAEKFLDYYQDRRPRLFSGPLLYSVRKEEVRKRRRQEILHGKEHGKIVVHATTQKARNGLRFHITETLDEYISTLIDLVNAINGLEETFLAIRPHPVCNISEKEFRRLLPESEKIIMLNKGPFVDVLSSADLIISYSSTCIEEGIQNKVPVLLYDKWKRYKHFNIQEIDSKDNISKSPVYYITSPELLSGCISGVLDIFNDGSLEDEDLTEYKYPDNYRDNFTEFIDKTLN